MNKLSPPQRSSSEQFGKQSHKYARGHILADVQDVIDALADVHLAPGSEVLDVATGAGFTGLHLAELGHRVTFSDLTPEMLQRTREAVTDRGLQADYYQHPAEEMPYADAQFDLVTCRVAPHHFDSPSTFVAESARVLKPGGSFVLIDGTVPDGHPEAEAWIHQVEQLRDPSHNRFVTPDQWVAMCQQHGFGVQTCRTALRKQPDLDWYFETAATSESNRTAVRELVANAPSSARELFSIAVEDGKTVWWWTMLTLVAKK